MLSVVYVLITTGEAGIRQVGNHRVVSDFRVHLGRQYHQFLRFIISASQTSSP